VRVCVNPVAANSAGGRPGRNSADTSVRTCSHLLREGIVAPLGQEFLDLLEVLRRRWPGEKLYLVCDNGSPHRHPAVRARCADNQVEPVFLPTCGSWPNWIEAEFAALRHSSLNGTDNRSHTEQNAAIAGCVRWHDARAHPRTGFATDSPIRTRTGYPAKPA
jgi:transposase